MPHISQYFMYQQTSTEQESCLIKKMPALGASFDQVKLADTF